MPVSEVEVKGDDIMLAYEDIKKTRLDYNISQTKLAEISGFSKSQISAWELGKKVPLESEINKLNSALRDTTLKIDQGKLDVKKKKIQYSGTEKSCLQ